MDTLIGRETVVGREMERGIAWSAVLAGAVLGLALHALLFTLGAALGLTLGDQRLGLGFGVWLIIIEVVAVSIGAFIAAALSRRGTVLGGALTGVLAWGLIVAAQMLRGTIGAGSTAESAAWTSFLGVLFALGAGAVMGVVGSWAIRRRAPRATATTNVTPSEPLPV